jgi:uncharacterized protein (DUF697 family)
MGTRKQEALRCVHRYALGGAAFAALPLPFSTTAGLTTMETHLLKKLGDLYGSPLSAKAITGAGGTFAMMGRGLRRLSRSAGTRMPVLRIPIRMAIAAGTIESIGRAAVSYYERNHSHRANGSSS